MSQILFPNPPLTPGQSFVAPNGVTYTWDDTIGTGVWKAGAAGALTVTAGSITGTPAVGQTLTYVSGVASGGQPPYSLSHEWFVDGVGTGVATPTFNVTSAQAGKAITVTVTATDGAAATATATTTPVNIPSSLTITSPGTISGSPQVGGTLNYTTGTATGGTGAIAYTWQWFITPSTPIGPIGTLGSITVPAGALGQNIYVKLIATDSATPTANTATADTANFPASGTITPAGITGAAAPTTIPGTASFTWADAPGTLTATGCIEFSIDAGATWVTSASVTNAPATTVLTRWVNVPLSGTCGDSPGNAPITGTLTSGGATSTFNFTMDRTPNAITLSTNTETTTPNTVTSTNPSFTLSGSDSPSFIWGSVTGGGGTPEYSVTGPTGTWLPMPATLGTATVNPSATVHIRFTTGSAIVANVLTVNVGASTTAGQFQSGAFTVTVAAAPFPNTAFIPSTGPNATPALTNLPTDPLGNLQGTASTTNWNDGSPTLTASNMLMSIGAGVPPTLSSISPVPGNRVNVAWLPSYINGLAHDAFASGSFTNGAYTNTYTYQVKKQPANWPTPAVTNAALSTQQTTGLLTPDSYNSPVTVTFTTPTGAGAPPVLSNVYYELNGGGQTLVTVDTTTVVINPGDQIEIFADSASAISTTEGLTITMGSATPQLWTVATVTSLPTIATPTVTLPLSTTPVNPATNTPSGFVTIKGDGYNPSGGAGAQANSTWEVYKGSHPLTSTNTISGVSNTGYAWAETNPRNDGQTFRGTAYHAATNSFVMINNTGNIVRSTDNGGSWSNITTLFSSSSAPSGNGILNANGTLYAQGWNGSNNVVRRSTDGGLSWDAAVSLGLPASQMSVSLAYNGSEILGLAQDSLAGFYITRSTDGTAWTASSQISWPAGLGATSISGLVYGAGRWVAVSGAPGIMTSTNGNTWTSAGTGGAPGSIGSIQFMNGTFVIFAQDGSGNPYIASSTDGLSWTPRTVPGGLGVGFQFSASGGGTFYGFSQQGGIVASADGVSWTSITPTPSAWTGGSVYGVSGAYGNGTIVFGSAGGRTASSAVASTVLTVAGCQTDGFLVGDVVVSGSGAAAGPATILSLNNTQVTVTSSTGWVNTNTQTLARATSSYSQITGSPFSKTTGTLTEIDVAQAAFTTSSTYYTRVKYGTNTPSAIESNYSAWSKFTTASAFIPAIGAPLGGGYFAGQIVGSGSTSGAGGLDNSGTIYNIIVAPVSSGGLSGTNTGGIQYGTAVAPNGNTNAQNENFGGLCTSEVLAGSATGGAAAYPVFNTFINGAGGPNGATAGGFNLATGGAGGGTGIGGYNDWYLPAKNELAILYFFLKPSSTSNTSPAGSNPVSVSPYTPNTLYGPGFPNQTSADGTGGLPDFRTGGTEAFSTTINYWSASQVSGLPNRAWGQNFSDGNQLNGSNLEKNYTYAARAMRRIPA